VNAAPRSSRDGSMPQLSARAALDVVQLVGDDVKPTRDTFPAERLRGSRVDIMNDAAYGRHCCSIFSAARRSLSGTSASCSNALAARGVSGRR